jgi:hypothetical protein
MYVRAKRIESRLIPLHPTEAMMEIAGIDGPVRMIVDERSIEGTGLIDIGYPVGQDRKGNYLVELPRETLQGAWRILVDRSEVVEEALEHQA